MRIFKKRTSSASHTQNDLIATCRRIAEQPLDDPETRAAIEAYFKAKDVKNYEASWRGHLQKFLKVIEGGETDLSRVLGIYFRTMYNKRFEASANYISFDKVSELPAPACIALLKTDLRESVLKQVSSRPTGAVMELGSGWSDHLFGLWLHGASPKLRYLACEITESGRKCAEVLAKLAPGMKLHTFPFNYEDPDFTKQSRFIGRDRQLVVYSSHSVEQVQQVSTTLVPSLCDLADEVVGIHFEPIGWQMDGPDSEHRRAHEARCREMRYNENFWSLLQAHERAGLIHIEEAQPYYIGMDYNPAAKVV